MSKTSKAAQIRQLADEGYSPQEIYTSLNSRMVLSKGYVEQVLYRYRHEKTNDRAVDCNSETIPRDEIEKVVEFFKSCFDRPFGDAFFKWADRLDITSAIDVLESYAREGQK